jgi:4-amino-4-deoxy-L-arabinose transferase-like glycosyltransferase
VPTEQWLLPLTALLCQVLAVALPAAGGGVIQDSDVFIAGVINLIILAVAAMWMARGCREGELKPVILGSLLLVALVFARYFDLFESLAARGLVFLIVGGVLFAEGFFYRRARQRTGEERPSP